MAISSQDGNSKMKTKAIDELFLELAQIRTVKTPREIELETRVRRLEEQLFDPSNRDIAINNLRGAVRSAWQAGYNDTPIDGWRASCDAELFAVLGIKNIQDLYLPHINEKMD